MKRFLALLMLAAMLFSTATAEEEEVYGEAVLQSGAEAAELAAELPDSIAPFIPEGMERNIFGEDDRMTVNRPGVYPYSAVAYMKCKGKCGCNWTGSGFMVSHSSLMTAAHCLICKEHNSFVSGITMYFGYQSDKNYLYRYTGGTRYWYGSNPYATGSFVCDDDYAYMKLEKRVGDTTGWFGIRHATPSQNGARFSVAGYRNGKMKAGRGNVTVLSDRVMTYQIDTEPGYSGCPVYDLDHYAVAINVGHNSRENLARRLTADLVNEMYANDMFD